MPFFIILSYNIVLDYFCLMINLIVKGVTIMKKKDNKKLRTYKQ